MNALRFVAASKGVVLFDWHQMLENASPASYLRDQHHPDGFQSIRFMKMITVSEATWSGVSITGTRKDLAKQIISELGGGGVFFFVDEQGLRHYIEGINSTNPNLISYFAQYERVSLPSPEIEMITLSPVDLRLLAEGSLLRIENEKTVYLLKDGKRHTIPSGRVFLQHGFSFDDVQVLSSHLIDIIPIGDQIN